MADVVLRSRMDSTGFTQGTDKMKSGIAGFKKSLSGMKGLIAGAFSITAILSLIKATVAYGSAISDAAYQTGISSVEYQALSAAARRAGASMEQVRVILTKLKIAQGEAITMGGTMAASFDELNISIAELKSLSITEILEKVAKALTNSNNSAETFAAAFKIMGTRSGPAMLEMLNELAEEGVGGLIDKYDKLSQIMSNDVAQSMDDLSDGFGEFMEKIKVKTAEGVHAWLELTTAMHQYYFDAPEIAQLSPEAAKRIREGALDKSGELAEKLKLAEDAAAAAEKEAAEIEKLQDQLDAATEAQTRKTLSHQQNIKLYDDEIKKLRTVEETGSEKERLQASLKIIGIQNKIADIKSKIAKEEEEAAKKTAKLAEDKAKAMAAAAQKEKKIAEDIAGIKSGENVSVAGVVADNMARIGGYIGGQANPALRKMDRQIQIQEQMKEYLKTLVNEGGLAD